MNRLISRSSHVQMKYGVSLKKWRYTTALVKQYDTAETRILGQERSTYLWMEKHYPDTFKGYINNPEVFDETKAAMLEYLRTGKMQPTTGAGLNAFDKLMAQNVTKFTVGLAFLIVPLAVLPFL